MRARERRAGGVTRGLPPNVRIVVGLIAATVLVTAAVIIVGAIRSGIGDAPGGWGKVIVAVIAALVAVRALRAAIRGTITVRGR